MGKGGARKSCHPGPFKEFIESRTPEAFLAQNILPRERDLVAP